ncbi:PspC domain-containing protein [Pseudoxanthomonas sp. J35]|uniref:PspC domain-containing protein n=1 Tax=Pseudoxanthomonas sp. J35 TaxID=935852 RepID=UPI0004B39B3E|nr:PspC domain-containing protein [Pseudoxanthomonas sp. J35]
MTRGATDRWDLAGLRKSAVDMWLAGICGGLGEHTPVPAWMWRALFLATALWGSPLLYLAFWIVMPEGRLEPDVVARRKQAAADGDGPPPG